MITKKKKSNDAEHEEQVLVCQYLDLLKIDYYAVPNGMFINAGNRSGYYMNKMKKEGFTPGVHDLVILLSKKSLYLEMKTKTGRLNNNQKKWHKLVQKYDYIISCTAYGFEDAKKIIDKERGVN